MPEPNEIMVSELVHQIDGLNLPEAFRLLAARFPQQTCFSTSFSYEDQLITDLLVESGAPVRIFTLDTGRLFPETYSVWSSTRQHYGLEITPYYPDQAALQQWVGSHGPNAFYESVALRQACCAIRKVEPLQRALRGMALWMTGLRAEHSPGRGELPILEWDARHQLIKYHPLLHYSTDQVLEEIRRRKVPYNPLHDRGFVSIGCAPCTRAIREGEDFRAGRWWWEDASKKECGLHEHSGKGPAAAAGS